MIYLAACLLCVIAVETFIRLHLMQQVAALGNISRKTTRVISSSRISDHWKEKALQRYSRDMAVSSLLIGGKLLLLGIVVSLAGIAFDSVSGVEPGSLEYLVTPQGLVLATVFSLLYLQVRKRLVTA